MYVFPVSLFGYKLKEGRDFSLFSFFHYYTSALSRVAGHKQTLSKYPMNEECQGPAKHKADITFQECHAYLVLIPDTRYGKSLLRDCSRQTLAHRISQID